MSSGRSTTSSGAVEKGVLRARGITLLEVLVSLVIFTTVMVAALFVFKQCLLEGRKKTVEKTMYADALEMLDFIERYLALAMVNDLAGKYRMNLVGSAERLRFVAPFSEGPGSDLAKFGIYLDGTCVKVNVVRVDRERPDFVFPEGFPGAQVLAEHVGNLRFSYFDGEAWCGQWDTEEADPHEAMLPRLVKIEAVVVSPERVEGKREERTFSRLVTMGDSPGRDDGRE